MANLQLCEPPVAVKTSSLFFCICKCLSLAKKAGSVAAEKKEEEILPLQICLPFLRAAEIILSPQNARLQLQHAYYICSCRRVLCPAVGYCGHRNERHICLEPRTQRFSLLSMELVQPCLLRLLPGISSLLISTLPVHSRAFFPKPLPSFS